MSRVGYAPIELPKGVEFAQQGTVVKVKGPKGELFQEIDPAISINLEDGELKLERASEQKKHKALHGLYRALVYNMVKGVSEGYTTKLELVGVGYRANMKGNQLELSLGYSHTILFVLPDEVKATAATEKGKNPIITLECADKQLIGQVAAKIKEQRPVEPYKGKGVRFVGQQIRRKAGKTAAK